VTGAAENMPTDGGSDSTGILHYTTHFGLLIGTAAATAALSRWNSMIGVEAAFGIYGALQSSMLALTLREPQPWWRKTRFVGLGAALSMAVVAAGFWVHRCSGAPSGLAKPMMVLALCSGLGAAIHALVFRAVFAVRLPPHAVAGVALGCAVTTLAVFESGLYRAGAAFGIAASWWLATTWWMAFSLGLATHESYISRRMSAILPRPD
jgi:hypothetical protein